MISMRRISLGGGFRYLMESVAAATARPNGPTSLAAYYAASGTPPGRFLGAGLADLDGGRGVEKGTVVTEEHSSTCSVCAVTRSPASRSAGARTRARSWPPVAGFDLTFSPSKSVSVAWALADEETTAVIYDCHRRGRRLRALLRRARGVPLPLGHERDRRGGHRRGRRDRVHALRLAGRRPPAPRRTSIVWNRARSISDGNWRTLDSKAIFKARSALSSMHQGVLSDLLTEALGVGWDARDRRHSERARWEITGVPRA